MHLSRKCFQFAAAVLLGTAAVSAQEAAPAAAAPHNVGSDACAACHDAVTTPFAKNPHHALETDKRRGHAGFACESCHGPGSKHADSLAAIDIVNPGKLNADEQNKLCLSCHRNEMTHIGRIAGGHASDGGPGCVGCHSIHGTDHRPMVVHAIADQNKLCASCHPSIWAEFQKPYKHRLAEGAMSCVGCHNPHGSGTETQRVAFANEPACVNCHGAMRGPFTFEHAPVRQEGCLACHVPHGSANPKMLTRHEVRFVCLECHANLPAAQATQGQLGGVPPSFHDMRSPRYQNCTVCHVKVHGSYVDHTFLR